MQHPEEAPATIDPTIREVTRRLKAAGFEITSSGGQHPDEDEDDMGWLAFVSLRCSPSNLIAEAHRLHELVRSWGVSDYDVDCAPPYTPGVCGIDAGYNPASREAELEVWGITDSMLGAV